MSSCTGGASGSTRPVGGAPAAAASGRPIVGIAAGGGTAPGLPESGTAAGPESSIAPPDRLKNGSLG